MVHNNSVESLSWMVTCEKQQLSLVDDGVDAAYVDVHPACEGKAGQAHAILHKQMVLSELRAADVCEAAETALLAEQLHAFEGDRDFILSARDRLLQIEVEGD